MPAATDPNDASPMSAISSKLPKFPFSLFKRRPAAKPGAKSVALDKAGPDPASAHKAADDFDREIMAVLHRSEGRAWIVAAAGLVAGLCGIGAATFTTTQQEVKAFVLRVNETTGTVDLIPELTGTSMTYEELAQKAAVSEYVRIRERYDWWGLRDDYKRTLLMSNDAVQREYKSLYDDDTGIQTVLGKRGRVDIEIDTITPHGFNNKLGNMTVRFKKTTYKVDSPNKQETSYWSADVSYTYDFMLGVRESYRILNSTGFQVLSYRTDPVLTGG